MAYIRTEQLILNKKLALSIDTLLVSCMSRMIKYIAIEDYNVNFHFLQVLQIG